MLNNSVKISYKIFLEAEDINQSRIISTTSFVTNLFLNCKNVYFHAAQIDNENDLEDFAIRLYVDQVIEEEECSSKEDAECFVQDMMEFLTAISMAQSYLDMEGSFSIEYKDLRKSYNFTSESGAYQCEFEKL